MTSHSTSVQAALIADRPVEPAPSVSRGALHVRPVLAFEDVYERWFDFVWRSLCRLGVPDAQIDDAVQDVFVVVHRRLDDFEGRSTVKTWLFGIALRVARDHRRAIGRRRARETMADLPEEPSGDSPLENAAKAEAVRVLYGLLDQLDHDRRAVFVMAELEQMSAPDIADALDVNVNTVYSRLRAARADFEDAVARHRARDGWRAW
jgi:RNA polymerase sigma-70 factor (ECF subfamily)